MFYDCFGTKDYPPQEWIAVVALEDLLAISLQAMRIGKQSLADDPADFAKAICNVISQAGYPPSELRAVVTEEWLAAFLEDNCNAMREWVLKPLPPHGGSKMSFKDTKPVYNAVKFMACLRQSRDLSNAIQQVWWGKLPFPK